MKKSLPKKRYTKAEEDALKMVRKAYTRSKQSRRNSCYWTADTSGTQTVDSNGSGDWEDHWDIQEKMALPWFQAPSADNFVSNVKSSMSVGRIESTMSKLINVNLGFIARPENSNDDKDRGKARVIQALLDNLFNKSQFKHQLNTAMRSALVHGDGFLQVYYLRKSRKVQIPVTSTKDMDEDQKKELKEGKRIYKTETIIEYDDIAFDPVKIQELYVDPSARRLHGNSYEAQWVIRRMLPSIEQFKAMFAGDRDAKNVSLVRPASFYAQEATEFFEPPHDIQGSDYVELLHYWDKQNDRYIVTANDVVIKDMPLPYNHKQIPFVQISAIPNPIDQFYNVGLPDRLMSVQTEQEILKNLTYDRLHITANPMLLVKKRAYGEFSKAYSEASPGLMLPVDDSTDVTPLQYPTMSYDMFRAQDELDREAVLATQIDPIQMGMTERYVSATTSMMSKEQMDSVIGAMVDSFSVGLNVAANQVVALMKQFYGTEKVTGKIGKTRKKIRLDGMEINPETLEIVEKRSDEYSYFEVKPEFFDISGDWDIRVSTDSMEVVSQALDAQKAQTAIAQLAPFMVDPSNPMAAQNPFGWVNGPKTVEWFLEKNKIPIRLMVDMTEDEDVARERAELQGKSIMAGQMVYGIPGEDDVHKAVHVEQLRSLNNRVANLEREIEDAIPQEALGPMAEAYIPILMQDPAIQALQGDLDRLRSIAMDLASHLKDDDMPKVMQEEITAEQTIGPAPMGPSVPMPPGLTPAAGSQPPMGPSANQNSGMMPEMGQ